MQIEELIVRVQHRRAAHNGHQDHVGRIVLGLEAVARVTPALALARARLRRGVRPCRRWRRRRHRGAGGGAEQRGDVHVVHAGGEREEGEYHLPGVRGAEDAVRPEYAADHRQSVGGLWREITHWNEVIVIVEQK